MRGIDRAIEHVASARRHLSRLLEQKRVENSEEVQKVLERLADDQIDLEETYAKSSSGPSEEKIDYSNV